MGVNALQQNHALKRSEVVRPHTVQLGLEMGIRCRHHHFKNFFVGDGAGGLHFFLQLNFQQPIVFQDFFQIGQVPLLLHRFDGHILAHQIAETAFPQRGDLTVQILRIQNVVALLIDHLALIVRHIVVFQQLFANVEVARLHLALSALDAAGHNARLNRFTFRHLQAIHDGAHPISRKNAHQRVVQTQVKP